MRKPKHFAVCIDNGEYETDLQLLKIYEVLEDKLAARHHEIRVVDESGEDYLYPESWFIPVEVPKTAERVLHKLATTPA